MEPLVRYILTDNELKIFDSYTYPGRDFREILKHISTVNPGANVFRHRTICGMCLEWATHNFLYKLNVNRDETKDVDIEYPQKWYFRILYPIAGILSFPFIV
jgi:hypothetical protein